MSQNSSSGGLSLKALASFGGASVVGLLGIGTLIGYSLGRWTVRSSAKSQVSNNLANAAKFKSELNWDQQTKLFLEAYPQLRDSFLTYLKNVYKLHEVALKRVHTLCDETILGGKYNRALLVTNSTQIIAKNLNVDSSLFMKEAVILGWCIEILQALFLVADDIMDSSQTRRGKPCWYKRPDIQMDAVNDALILESFMYFIIDNSFEDPDKKLKIFKLFHDVSLDTEMGQMLDLLSQPQGRKGADVLANFNLTLYKQIVHYKTALYSFYLPIACALIASDSKEEKSFQIARELSIHLGTKFQIQDDYLDAYGSPEAIGKIGTDLRDHKCTWLLVQALQRASDSQLQIIKSNLGSEEGEASVKAVYNELNMPQIYEDQENSSYKEIESIANKNAHLLPPEITLSILNKIHKREK